MATPVTTVIVISVKLATEAAQEQPEEISITFLDGPEGLRAKRANNFIIIKNKTRPGITYLPEKKYYDHGSFYSSATNIGEFDTTSFGVSNKDRTFTSVGDCIPFGITPYQFSTWNIAVGFSKL